jgi:hypothetical protein
MPGGRLFLANLQQYLSSDTKYPNFWKYWRFVFLAGLLLVVFWWIYFAYSTVTIPYPIEYAEGSTQVITHFLINGQNPYSLENQPLGMNDYGMGYPMFVWPFAQLLGDTLFIHRAVTFLFLILSFFLTSKTIYRINKDAPLAISCGVLIVIGLAARGGLGAFPSAMGAFLFLAGTLIPYNRSFDRVGLILSGSLCLLAYFTKPYFLFAFSIVASYLFIFVSKKKGLLYSLFFILTLLLFLLVIRYSYKLYFIDTVFGNLGQARRSLSHLYDQSRELVLEYFPSIIAILGLLVLSIAKLKLRLISFKELFAWINLGSLEKPLISKSPHYFAYFFLCSAAVFIFILGPYPGSWDYSYQILLPPFLLLLFNMLRGQNLYSLFFMPALLFNMVWLCQIYLNPLSLRQRDSQDWTRLYQYVDSSKQILNSPLIVSEMIQLKMQVIDSGVTADYYSIKPYSPNPLLGPTYDAVQSQGQQYSRIINEKIKNLEFGELILTEGDYRLYPYNLIERYYTKVTSLPVDLPQTGQQWTIDIWKPITSTQNMKP